MAVLQNGSNATGATGTDLNWDCDALALHSFRLVDPVVAMTRFVIQSLFSPIVLVFGLVTNVINIIILTRKEMRSSTNAYLTMVAVCDIGYLLFAYLQGLKNMVLTLHLSSTYMTLHTYMGPFCSLFSNVSVWIICSFTVERFIAVRWPMKGIMWCTLQNAKRTIAYVALLAVLLTSNEFFVWPQMARVNGTNCTMWRTRPNTILALDAFKATIHYNWIMPILFQFIPFFLLLVLNGFLIKSVITAQKERAKMTATGSACNGSDANASACKPPPYSNARCKNSNGPPADAPNRRRSATNEGTLKSESKITVLLIAVVLLFLICHLPSAFVLLHNDYQNRKYPHRLPPEQTVRRLVIGNASNALVQLNSATNFILYSFLSRKFVTIFRRLLRNAMPCLFKAKAYRTGTETVDMQDSRALLAPVGSTPAQSIAVTTTSTHARDKKMLHVAYCTAANASNTAACTSFSSRNGL